MMRQTLLKSCFCFLTAALLHGAEYYVGENAQFKTIGEGIRAMKPGDTLTILPGTYFESVEHAGLGNAEKKTVIRAQRAGSVLLRGDKEAPVFHPVSGTRFIFVCDWKENALAVNERDSLKILLPSATLRDLEFERGRFFHDRKNGKLYISTTDGELPSRHYYTVSVIRGSGIFLKNPVNVTIDGIYVTGFYSHERVENRMSSALYGIRINFGINCTIRNCRAFFNANGIHSGHGDGNTNGLGIYSTFNFGDNWFVDAVGSYFYHRQKIKSYTPSGFDVDSKYHAEGWHASAFIGKRLNFEQNCFIEPNAGIRYMLIDNISYRTNYNTRVTASASDYFSVSAGITGGKEFQLENQGILDIYGRFNLIHDRDGKSVLQVADYSFTEDMSALQYELGGGVSFSWNEGKNVTYLDAVTLLGSTVRAPVEVQFGMRFGF